MPRISRSLNQVLVFSGLLLSLLAVPNIGSAAWQESLNAEQQSKLEQAKGAIRRVEANVKLAVATAGSGDSALTGSRAKLTKVRLGNSAAELEQVRAIVKDLPASNADFKAFLDTINSLDSSIAAIQSRLDGKSPAGKKESQPDAKPEARANDKEMATPDDDGSSGQTVKLSYQQKDDLGKANFNLREVEGNVQALTKLLEQYQHQEDQLAIPYRKIAGAMATIENAQRKYGWTVDQLKNLPANGEGVGEVISRSKSTSVALKSAADYLVPLNQKLQQLIDPASYPELGNDQKRLSELSRMFSDPRIFLSQLQQAAEYLKQATPAAEEAQRIGQKYARLIQQQSPEGKQLQQSIDYLRRQQQAFLAAAEAQRKSLPAEIEKYLGKTRQYAQQAVAEQKPLFFTGGIPQQLGFAEERIALLKVLDPTTAEQAQKDLGELKSQLKQAQQKLRQQIIDENQLPSDRYQGSDREDTIAVAKDAWKHQQDKFQVLAERIPAESWSRETMWQYNNGTWYFVDRSKLQVQLILADSSNPQQAIIRPITVIKNHQKGDSMIGVPLFSADDELQPSSYLLRSRIK